MSIHTTWPPVAGFQPARRLHFTIASTLVAAGAVLLSASAPAATTPATTTASAKHVRHHRDIHAVAKPVQHVHAKPRSETTESRQHFGVRPAVFEQRPLSSTPFGMTESHRKPALRSTVAYVVDERTHEALFDKNSDAVVPIASITKLMTSMVVLDSKASLAEEITVTDEDRDYEKMTGSRLSVGSTLNRADMLHIALMASENRAAAALSRYYPGGRPAFISAMNAKAKALGMTDTHFESPTGLTSKNVSSARDLIKMVDAAYQYPLIRTFSTDRSYTVNTGKRTIAYRSTNALIRDPRWEIGLQKTGFINEAGICLVMQTTIADRPLVMVLLDSSGRYADFADATALRSFIISDERPRLTANNSSQGGS
jgi:serine-type D-Ala-D-Ala endopeptidase (penicillin-binding protein 7)